MGFLAVSWNGDTKGIPIRGLTLMANDEKHPYREARRSAVSRVRQTRGGFSGRPEGTL
jgi:hypothetical protein